ncbi:MAG: M28 family metallopeptidase [Candidatus Kapaibacteriales bacterium]
MALRLIFISAIALFSLSISYSNEPYKPKERLADQMLVKYKSIAEKILASATKDSTSWDRLAALCDGFGHRLSGSEALEKAIAWCEEEMKKDGLENVNKEEVMVPNWKRGQENLKMTSPYHKHMAMLGLGGSIATPATGINAEVFVVNSLDELNENASKAKGKIVLFNMPWEGYGKTVQYRFYGAQWAARHGAFASLIRSVSPIGMNNPHTGMMGAYVDSIPAIPHAAITAEDADLLQRMQENGVTPRLSLKMQAKFEDDALSHNVMGEYRGHTYPDEILAIGGHIDSWDVGTGAHDDAAGCIVTWEAVKLLKDLGLQPKRTIRVVLWTNEENGQMGGRKYAENHGEEPHHLMFESDSGIWEPETMGFTGPDSLLAYWQAMEPTLQLIFPTVQCTPGGGGVDITPMMELGVPGSSINTDDKGTYFWYHHTDSDTVDKVDPEHVNLCVATIALAMYIYADM